MTAIAPVQFPALGTTAVLLVTEPAALGAARTVLDEELDGTDRAASRFRDDSELSLLNRSAGEWVAVSARLVELLRVALLAARRTGGLVDPTVGQALRVLGYDRTFAEVAPDGPPVSVTVGAVPGWRTIDLDPALGRARIPPGVSLDLGATAKAACADSAARRAAELTGAGVLVSLGGDLAAAGPAPEGGWSVRLADDHAVSPDTPGPAVAISSGGLATSGTAVRRWARGGLVLHHLLDPGTGRPAAPCWRTVSVAAASCVDANTASTAAILLGSAAPTWLAERGLPARLVAEDGRVRTVAGWPEDGEPGW